MQSVSINYSDRVTHTAHNVCRMLRVTFAAIPIIAGLDKFTNILTDWTQYLAPFFPELINVSPQTFMYGVGVIEIIAGLGVAFRPKYFAPVVGVWMLGIVMNLLVLGDYYDIAARDLGLAMGAFGLGALANAFDQLEKGHTSYDDNITPINEKDSRDPYIDLAA